MFTSIFSLAVSAMFGSTEASNLPVWQMDYRQAREIAVREQKPLAVVIGSGTASWDKVVNGGNLAAETANTLRTEYVCVFVDKTTPDGAKLAKDFEIADTGLVISNRKADLQAFRYAGSMPDSDLRLVAMRYSDPNYVVKSTDTTPAARPAAPVAPVVYYQNGGCPNCRPR